MDNNKKRTEEELADLKEEIESFKKEKERVKTIVGQIGGMPSFDTKALNIIFIVLILACIVGSLMTGGIVRLVMIELAIVALSIKLIYLMNKQARVNHFQLWILSSIEWQINEMMKTIKAQRADKPDQAQADLIRVG